MKIKSPRTSQPRQRLFSPTISIIYFLSANCIDLNSTLL